MVGGCLAAGCWTLVQSEVVVPYAERLVGSPCGRGLRQQDVLQALGRVVS